ncbi:MAG: hypothetical protein K2F80_05355, partial [Muribaculaceae bacterium]|nr:hypothetical protein [Muribaculaceae bacterium]
CKQKTPSPLASCLVGSEMGIRDRSDEEQKIADYLTRHGESFLNKMSVDLNIVTHRLIQTLGEMEFNGVVISHPGGKYSLA